MNGPDELKARIDTLSPMAVRFVARLVDSLANAPASNRAAVDAILLLRAFRADETQVPGRYQLIEIPADVFRALEDVPTTAFAADGPKIPCTYGGLESAARVELDRSDAKITVGGIQILACTVHAEWHLAR